MRYGVLTVTDPSLGSGYMDERKFTEARCSAALNVLGQLYIYVSTFTVMFLEAMTPRIVSLVARMPRVSSRGHCNFVEDSFTSTEIKSNFQWPVHVQG